MKKILLCTLVLLLCLLAACGGTTEPSASPSSEPSPSVSPSAAPTNSPTQKPTPTPEPRVELLGYEEYFSEEREIEALPFESEMDIPFGVADDDWNKLIRRKDGFVVTEDFNCGPAVVVDKDGYYREVAFSKDNKLYITENNGETPIMVYEATERLMLLNYKEGGPTGGVILGFVDGTRRYRLYVPTGTVDFMFDLPDTLCWNEWDADTTPKDSVFVDEEGLLTNQTWVCPIGGGDSWCRAYADAMGYDYENTEFDGKVPFWYDSTTGKWRTWDGFGWAMDIVGIPKELRVYDTEKVSYEEYFSELRPIEDRELRFEKWAYDFSEQSIRRTSDSKVVATNVLTRWDFCMAGNEHGLAYCAGGERVYLYNDATEQTELLYQSNGEKIEFLDGGGPVVFFDVGQKIYRIYLPDRTLDFICDRSYTSEYNERSIVWADEENSFYFEAISNTDICFSVIDAGWYVDDAAAAGMDFADYCIRKSESQEAGPGLVWYSSILGKYICNGRCGQTLGLSDEEMISDIQWYVYEYLGDIEAVLA